MKFAWIILAGVAFAATCHAQPDLRETDTETVAFGFSKALAVTVGAGGDYWGFGCMFGPVYLDFVGNYKKWAPDESLINKPFGWFQEVGKPTYMRKGFGLGTGVHSYGRLYLYAGADFTWTPTYTAFRSSATNVVWYTGPDQEFKLGWWTMAHFRLWPRGFTVGAGYGETRGVFASVAFGSI